MDAKDIPQVIVDLLDERAGKKHSRDGVVLITLAELLTLYDEIREKELLELESISLPSLGKVVRSVGLIGHPDSGKTELRNGVLGIDETPTIPITAEKLDEIIFLD